MFIINKTTVFGIVVNTSFEFILHSNRYRIRQCYISSRKTHIIKVEWHWRSVYVDIIELRDMNHTIFDRCLRSVERKNFAKHCYGSLHGRGALQEVTCVTHYRQRSDTKPLPEPMLTHLQSCSLTFRLEQFNKYSWTWSKTRVRRLRF